MAVDVGSAVGYLDLDISGFLAGLKSAQDEADSASKNIALKIGGNLSGAGKTLTSVGTTLTKNVTVPLLGIGAAGLKVATDFEKGMSEVKAISGATGKDFDDLKDKAIELGGSTAFSANEVAAGMTEMAKAGWTSQQIIDGMGGVLDAAAASGEGLATVSTIVADTITGFGMEAKDSTVIADLLTQAANSGTIGITDLGESFKYIAPVAGSMGLSVSDVTTALSAMSMAGIKGSQAGTSLRGMLTRMVKPTDAVASAMKKLGINLTEQDGSFKSLDTIVADMRSSFSGLTDEQKTYYAATLAGQEGMSGLLSLLNLSQDEYDAISKSMDESGGVAGKTAEVMQDNLQSRVEQLGGALESLAIRLADFVIPYIQRFVEWLTALVDKFIALDPETQKTILKFAGIVAAAGPVIAVIGKVVTAVGGLITAYGKLSSGFKAVAAGGKAGTGILAKLGGAFAGITAPIAAVIATVALLVAAFVSLWKNNEEFRNKVIGIWNQVKTTFSNFAQGIVDRLNSLGFNFTSITDVLKAVWEGFCNILAPIFAGAFQIVANTLQVICNVILGVIDVFIALFKGDWQGVWDAVKGIFESVWNYIVSVFQTIGTTLLGVLETVCSWFGTTWSATWESIKTFFVNTWNSIVLWFQMALLNVSMFFTNIWNSISTFFSQIWTNITTTITTAWESIKTTISTAVTSVWQTITSIWNSIKATISTALMMISATISTIWNSIKTTISTIVSGIWTTISTTFSSIKTTATTVWNGVKTAITSPINAAKTVISSVVNSIKSTISSGFNSAKSTVSSVFTSIKNSITSVMNSAKTKVTNAINTIKSKFKFTWSLPTLKMPHVTVSWSTEGWLGSAAEFLGLPGIPNFDVSWYKKAMANGMILDEATIFGFNQKTGKFLGGGEAGSETIVGTNSLLNMIRQTVAETFGPIITAAIEIARASIELGYVTYEGFVKQARALEKIAERSNGSSGNGDTFVFYSPKAIDEIEAAKQMKKTKRDLAEGF